MKILVILASYNGEKYIKEQIDSILSQEEVDLDIKIFDDVSTDDTLNVLEYFKNNNQIEIIQNPIGTGSAANNFLNAIKNNNFENISKYDFIAFADQDDIWLPRKLKAATEILLQNQSDLYCSNLILWDEQTSIEMIINKSYPQKKYDYLFEGGSAGCTYVFTNKFYLGLKNILKNVNYANWKYFSHDWFVYFVARNNNFKVSIDSNAYIKYRIHASNVHGQLNKNSLFAVKARLKLIKEGWYFKQIKGYSSILDKDSVEFRIYEMYSRSYFSRMYIIFRYNFQLIRSSKKFIQFFLVSLLPINIKK